MYLCMLAAKSGGTLQAPYQARKVIAEIAAAGKDWQAMTLHAIHLREDGKGREAVDMALQICQTTEPAPPNRYNDAEVLKNVLLPWKTWFEVLPESDKESKQLAWEYGARVWDDPEACAFHSRAENVEEGTEDWLQYATKGAMGGKLRSMQDVGMYLLSLHGWFPKNDKVPVSRQPDSKMGFEWLELSINTEPYVAGARIFAGMALVLREHGDRRGGLGYLRKGLEFLAKQPQSEKEGFTAAEKRDAEGLLENLISAWDTSVLVLLAGEQETIVKSSDYLPRPIIPVLKDLTPLILTAQ
jgi:hypothetical protein